MSENQVAEISAGRIEALCRQLAEQGWDSSRHALEDLQGADLRSAKAYRVAAASVAGVYELRRDALSSSPERTKDLDRFAREARAQEVEFVRLFRLGLADSLFLCMVTEDASQAIASTSVTGTGVDPASQAVGAVGEISIGDAIGFCHELARGGWESAAVISDALTESDSQVVPVWLASAEALAHEYEERAAETRSPDRPTMDMERLSQALRRTVESQPLKVFHVFDAYGWHGMCVLSGDQTQAIGAIAMKR